MPYFSGFQSALLYPPNWIFAVLPLAKAINWSIAFHAWWLASGVYLWLRYWGVRQIAAVFGGACIMFSAPFFLHVYAGHLTNLCVMAWVPWLVYCLVRWQGSRRYTWVIAGGAVVGMQIFAGHPQYVYYTGIVVTLYVLLTAFLVLKKERWLYLGGFVGMYLLGTMLAAGQLLPGFEASGEGVRSGGTEKVFAGSYSFPPGNLLTVVVPGIFGDEKGLRYWGFWLYWEMIAFCGVIALCCAVIGIFEKGEGRRERMVLGLTAIIAVVLAMGKYTFVFDLLYAALPGFDLFRGTSKFIFFFALAVSVLAGLGADRVLRTPELFRNRGVVLGAALGVVFLWVLAVLIGAGDAQTGFWAGVRKSIWNKGDVTHIPEGVYFSDEVAKAAVHYSSSGFWMAGLLVLFFLLAILAMRRRPAIGYVLLVAGMVELAVFAAKYRASFPISSLSFDAQAQAIGGNPDQLRVLDLSGVNRGMISGLPDLWGDDPGVLKRYAELMTVAQGRSAAEAGQHVPMVKPHPIWRMLRGEYVFQPQEGGNVSLLTFSSEPLRRFELVPEYLVLDDRDVILSTVLSDTFDPLKQVILEENPGIVVSMYEGDAPEGRWEITSEDTDHVVVSVETPRPAILLMTDPYSKSWRVKNLSGDAPQDRYQVMPANYAIRGIPIEAGSHRLKIYYRPRTLTLGLAISFVTVLGSIGFLVWSRRNVKREAESG
ncbi:MAG: hypothetical protein AAF591_02560 [Verrucomicrobiota bacterium]